MRRFALGIGSHAPPAISRVRWLLLAAVPPTVLLVRRRRALGLPRSLSTALAVSVPLAVAGALPRSRSRHVLLWAAQMWAYTAAFEIPYDRPERIASRLRVVEPVRADRALAGGTTPTERLQGALRDPARVSWLDRALTAVYAFWEAEPHLAMGAVLLLRPDRFGALATRQAATFDLTLAGYWLLPTAPPWWAAERAGVLHGDVQRVVMRVLRDLRGKPLEQDDVVGANPWGSMPSDHFAAALAAALALAELHPAAGAAGLSYALVLGVALVYLGEHYVVDLLAGGGLALAVAALEPALGPVARRVDARWRRLEP
ncbi:phosphatase PAP2 family protein [Conexibacter arvalis]|uniref:Membrane-associated phospholipid phosphatase n=1 Tax=Conexibacter arvalis TaxID=912552 RepID=A0A840IEM0_9ACTN|nr:phosphatase PAP2 family protein [Conexibacter arvalis]MBB4662380.1 membrane-associated phospholipid phosphatase [Conexibacter arvalis]